MRAALQVSLPTASHLPRRCIPPAPSELARYVLPAAGSSLGGQSWRPRPEVLTSFIAIVVAVAGRLVSWRQPTLDAVFLRVSAEGLWLAGSPVLLSGLLCWLWCVAFCSKVMHMLITRHA